MAWFITQSLLVILATFALGLVIGWLWWGRAWRRVPLGDSGAVRAVSERYEATIAERDAELVRLANDHRAQTASASSGAGDAATAADADRAGTRTTATGAPTADGERAGTAPADAAPGETAPADTDIGDAEPGDAGPAEQEPAEIVPDDLERIEGVGPRIAAALAGAGLLTYRDVAAADEEHLTAALRAAGLAFAPSLVTWPRQARLLADGDEAGVAALQAELLTAGRSRTDRPAGGSADPVTDAETAGTPAGEDAAQPSDGTEAEAAGPTAESAGPTAEPTAAPATGAAEASRAGEVTGGARPTDTTEPPEAQEPEEDELERVEGIGPRIARALRKAGIQTYRQLAEADAPTLQAALSASGLRFAPSLPTWSRQAAYLADGDEAGFLALTRTLVPDRENGRPS